MDSNTINNDSNATDQNIGSADTIVTTTTSSNVNIEYIGDATTSNSQIEPEVSDGNIGSTNS